MRALRFRRDVAFGLVVAVMASTPLQAQFGGLRRAVERRVEQKAEDRAQAANLIQPTFDQTTIEITAERLDRYVAAMEKLKARRAVNRQRYEVLQTQRSALIDSSNAADNQRDRQAYYGRGGPLRSLPERSEEGAGGAERTTDQGADGAHAA
ncbi:MAG: hypothetical protein U5K74_03065 [Gemmatimonadaceae bacterium]|nr:hypothetical protein [Gemmatimonadaceae bacterium]